MAKGETITTIGLRLLTRVFGILCTMVYSFVQVNCFVCPTASVCQCCTCYKKLVHYI